MQIIDKTSVGNVVRRSIEKKILKLFFFLHALKIDFTPFVLFLFLFHLPTLPVCIVRCKIQVSGEKEKHFKVPMYILEVPPISLHILPASFPGLFCYFLKFQVLKNNSTISYDFLMFLLVSLFSLYIIRKYVVQCTLQAHMFHFTVYFFLAYEASVFALVFCDFLLPLSQITVDFKKIPDT